MRTSTKRLSSLYATLLSTAFLALPYVAFADPLHPLGSKVTIEGVIGKFIGAALGVTGSLALVMFVWSGASWMLAAGSADKIKVAKRTMIYAVTGLIVCFSSYTILQFVLNTAIFTAVSPTPTTP